MNGRQRNATNAQIWGKQNDSNYDGNCTSRHCQSGTYEISGRWIFVGGSVRARYYHILCFLRFMDNNRNGVDRTDDRLWKIRDLFEITRTNFSKFYNPSERLAVDEVIVKFKGRVLFKQYIPKNGNVSASKCSNYVTLQDIHMT